MFVVCNCLCILERISVAEEISVRSPRFSPDGSKLVYLESLPGQAHHECFKLQLVIVIFIN